MKTVEDIITLFEKANESLLKYDVELFRNQVSERALCGALMLHMHDIIRLDEEYKGYYTDIEYNRNKGGQHPYYKTIRGIDDESIRITCDLIIHSRGEKLEQDNLLAVEMKKSTRRRDEKDKDKKRLIALTKDSYEPEWIYDGKSLPKHVCRYILGVYYEINYIQQTVEIEYYYKGKLMRKYHRNTETVQYIQ